MSALWQVLHGEVLTLPNCPERMQLVVHINRFAYSLPSECGYSLCPCCDPKLLEKFYNETTLPDAETLLRTSTDEVVPFCMKYFESFLHEGSCKSGLCPAFLLLSMECLSIIVKRSLYPAFRSQNRLKEEGVRS